MKNDKITRQKKKDIMTDLNKKLEWLYKNTSHNVIWIALFGSQNYEMDLNTEEYRSDIDAKAVCIPSMRELLRDEKLVSKVYKLEDGSQIEVKDIRLFIRTLKKQNPSYLETLFTKYYICDERFKKVLDMADDIALADRKRLFKSILGMICQKKKNIDKSFGSNEGRCVGYGYDPKEMSNIARLYFLSCDLILRKKTLRESLVPDECYKKTCIDYKVNPVDVNTAFLESNKFFIASKKMIENYLKNELPVDEECYKKLDNVVLSLLEESLKNELKNGTNNSETLMHMH